MATGFTDFSEYTLGVKPSDWTQKLVDNETTWTVEEDGAGGPRYLHHADAGAVDKAFYAIKWDQTPDSQDAEIAFEFEGATAGNQFYMLAFLRATTDETSVVGPNNQATYTGTVYIGMGGDNEDRLRVYTATSSSTQLDGATVTARSLNTRYRMRARVGDGNRLKMKVWLATDPQPDWQYDVASTETAVSGWNGLATFRADGGIKVFKYAWATDGDTAPITGVVEGIPATVLKNGDGTLATGIGVTRTITRASDATQYFTGAQTTDATTAELPEIDLSATAAAENEEVDDKIAIDSPAVPGIKSMTIRRTVENVG